MIDDRIRGLVIGLLALGLSLMPDLPNSPIAPGWMLVGAGLALQLGLFALRRWVQRQERAQGIDDAWLPTLNHVGALVADGLTVLLVAAAVFQGVLVRASTI